MRSEYHYRLLIENANETIFVIQDGKIKFCNSKASELSGYSEDELISIPFTEFIYEDDKDFVIERHLKRLAGENVESRYKFRLLGKNKDVIWVEINSIKIDWEGKIATLNFISDITESKKTEEALRESEEKFRVMSEMLPQIIFETDEIGNLTYVNKQSFNILGYDENESVLGLPSINFHIPEERERVNNNILLRISGKKLESNEYTMLRKDGSTFPALVYSNPIFKDGKPVGLRGIIIDITELKQAEKDLKEEKDRFRLLTESMKDVVWVLDAETLYFTYVSPSVFELRGYTPDEIISQPVDAALTPEGAELLKDFIRTHIEKLKTGVEPFDKFFTEEVEQPCKDGTTVWTEVITKYHLNKKTNHIEIHGVTRDISESNKAEKALRESEFRLSRAEKAAKFGNWKLILGDKEMISSEGARIIYGVNKEIMLLKDIQEIPLPEYRNILDNALIDLVTKDIPYNIEFKIRRPNDGKIFDVHSIAEFDKENNIVYGVVQDITERKAIEEELRASEEKFKAIANYAASWEAWFGPKGDLLWMNPYSYQLTGYTPEECLASTDFFSMVIAEEDIEMIKKRLPKALKGSSGENLEFRIVRKDGSKFWIAMSWQPILDSNGHSLGFRTSSRDITERKIIEEELKLQNNKLQKANSEKDKFFSIIAHDIRSPFTGFIGLTELMVSDLRSMTLEDINIIAGKMHTSANNLFRLLTNLLDWSKIQRGLTAFNPEKLSLKKITEDNIQVFYETAKRKEIEINENINDNVFVIADKDMLETIIRNLVSNAIKFTKKNGVVTISAKQFSDKVKVSIADTGIGMDKELINDLFKVDKQTNRKGTDNEPSTGLGLILCYEFIEKHGGNIKVESEVGKGSTFSFTLPANKLS